MFTETLEAIRLSRFGTEEQRALANHKLERLADELQCMGYKPYQYGPFDYKGFKEVKELKELYQKGLQDKDKILADLRLLEQSYNCLNNLFNDVVKDNEVMREKLSLLKSILS